MGAVPVKPLPIWVGPAGEAHLIRQAALGTPTCLCAWLLHLPGAHPIWAHYLLSVASLRDEPGYEPAQRHYPGAEYELVICALDEAGRPQPGRPDTWQPLTPPNVVIQWDGTGDAGAELVARHVIPVVVDGALWVETQGIRGAREHWERFVRRAALDEAGVHTVDPLLRRGDA